MWRAGHLVGVLVVASGTAVFADTGRAVIRDTSETSTRVGTATFIDATDGLTVSVQVSQVSPGKHGLHLHEFGSCEDVGKAAGGHYNPQHVQHGFLPTDGFTGAHAGDLGNIEVGTDGSGTLKLVIAGVKVSGGTYSIAGRSIVLHDKVDDFGQPTGNAGGRIGCGPILITGQ